LDIVNVTTANVCRLEAGAPSRNDTAHRDCVEITHRHKGESK